MASTCFASASRIVAVCSSRRLPELRGISIGATSAATRETSLKFCKRNVSAAAAVVSRLYGDGPRLDLVTGQLPSKSGSYAPQFRTFSLRTGNLQSGHLTARRAETTVGLNRNFRIHTPF